MGTRCISLPTVIPQVVVNAVLPVHHTMHQAFTKRCLVLFGPLELTTYGAILAEFVQICKAVAIGFAVMGFIGYFVKLIHIPM